MPRGRPRKNPLPVTPVIPEAKIEQAEIEQVNLNPMTEVKNVPLPTREIFSSAKKKKDDDTPRCACCGEKVYSNRRLNLELLTSLSSYHFDVTDIRPYICGKCAMELGKVINDWLIKNGAEIKPYNKWINVEKK